MHIVAGWAEWDQRGVTRVRVVMASRLPPQTVVWLRAPVLRFPDLPNLFPVSSLTLLIINIAPPRGSSSASELQSPSPRIPFLPFDSSVALPFLSCRPLPCNPFPEYHLHPLAPIDLIYRRMMYFDWGRFPHILDTVVLAALGSGDDQLVRTLRLTHRATRDFIDHRIVQHVVCVQRPFALRTVVGRVRLAFEEPEVAARIRAFDMHMGYNMTMRPYVDHYKPFKLPNLRFMRVFSVHRDGDPKFWLPDDARGLTMIYLVTKPYNNGYSWFVFRAKTPTFASRCITLAPGAYCMKGEDDDSHSAEQNDIDAFTKLVGKSPADLSLGKGFIGAIMNSGAPVQRLSNRTGLPFYPEPPVEDCAVVGPRDLAKDMLDKFTNDRHTGQYPCRFVTLVDWRAELSDHVRRRVVADRVHPQGLLGALERLRNLRHLRTR